MDVRARERAQLMTEGPCSRLDSAQTQVLPRWTPGGTCWASGSNTRHDSWELQVPVFAYGITTSFGRVQSRVLRNDRQNHSQSSNPPNVNKMMLDGYCMVRQGQGRVQTAHPRYVSIHSHPPTCALKCFLVSGPSSSVQCSSRLQAFT